MHLMPGAVSGMQGGVKVGASARPAASIAHSPSCCLCVIARPSLLCLLLHPYRCLPPSQLEHSSCCRMPTRIPTAACLSLCLCASTLQRSTRRG